VPPQTKEETIRLLVETVREESSDDRTVAHPAV
jgi:hypothetical protein